ncbi:exopolysaccharide biosynthesis polyprenyl glycosylphosphotransferase [Roseibium sp.]|uniref:exopolysaccharide biosynthesis polyprenyl glycosylphosphotransferase n=1 Tax=Roseibium sp. TaxID=1936156 RepID=UPI003B50F79F
MTDNVYGFQDAGLGHVVNRATTSQTSHVLKRGLDLFGSICGLLLLAPLFTILAIAIKLTSKGPVLFKQDRHGVGGKTFKAYKFRSMYVDQCDHSGVRQTIKNDPRITPIGRFLRRSNFDELPQLFNVLKGEMSLVGPRPHVPGMLANGVPYEQFDPRYQSRHRVKPGITGLAQVNGFRGETKTARAASMRLYYDLKYIEVRSLFLDVRIIVNTVIQEFFKGKGY